MFASKVKKIESKFWFGSKTEIKTNLEVAGGGTSLKKSEEVFKSNINLNFFQPASIITWKYFLIEGNKNCWWTKLVLLYWLYNVPNLWLCVMTVNIIAAMLILCLVYFKWLRSILKFQFKWTTFQFSLRTFFVVVHFQPNCFSICKLFPKIFIRY